MRKHAVNLLKLVFVAALMWWVFTQVNWRDSYVRTAGTGAGAQEVQTFGRIVGDWDRPLVRFLPEGATEPIELEPREGELRLVVGLPSYWRNLDVWWFLLGTFCYLLSVQFAATRWWWLLRVNDLPVGYWASTRFTWIGIFFNNVVPGQTGGDLVKAIYVMRRSEGARVPAMMSVVVDRIMGLGSLAMLAAFTVLFYLDKPEFSALAVALWGVLLGVVLLGVVAFSRRIRSFIRLSDLLERLPRRASDLLRHIDRAVFFYRAHTRGMTWWMLAGILNHVSSVLSYAFVGKALGVGVSLVEYFVLIPIIVIVSAVPVAPNGWGVGEFMFRKLFSEYTTVVGVSASSMGTRGVALSILYRIMLTLTSLVGGLMFFFDKNRVTRAEMVEQAAREEEEEAELDAEMAQEIEAESAESV